MNTEQTDFSGIAARYEQDSVIQKSAAEKLISLLDIQQNDHVLDLGCGTGSLARKIKMMTAGNVTGIDPSKGMIQEAIAKQDGLDITYAVNTAEGLEYQDVFNVIFCNSAFQWIRDPGKALLNCYSALQKSGRMGIQAPAKKTYCPNFLKAIDEVEKDPRTAKIFAGFRPPWLFLDTAEEYSALFTPAGFLVPFARIEEIKTLHTPGEVMTIFESGAAAGYLNQEYYSKPFDAIYSKAIREVVKGSFQRQANRDGKVELVFNRIYLVAIKE